MGFKPISTLVVVAAVAFAGAYFGSPILAARALNEAAQAGDEAELERLVDFPAFRASLKDELRDVMMARMRVDPRLGDGALAGLGLVLAPGLVNGAVDMLITPGTVAEVVRSGQTPDPTRRLRRKAEPEATPGDDGDDVHQSWGYRNLDTFGVTLTRRDSPDRSVTLLMDRRGLFDWKLSAVDIQDRP